MRPLRPLLKTSNRMDFGGVGVGGAGDVIETFDFHSALERLVPYESHDDLTAFSTPATSAAPGSYEAQGEEEEEGLLGCWGQNLRGSGGCTPGFQAGKGHFKNKFCKNCQALIVLPVERVCAAGHGDTGNKRSEGFWNEGAHGSFRVVNNTAACIDPPLAIYREAPPAAVRARWTRVPDHWIDEDGLTVRLCVAKGTLVPVLSLRSGHMHAAASSSPGGSMGDSPRPGGSPGPGSGANSPKLRVDASIAGGGSMGASPKRLRNGMLARGESSPLPSLSPLAISRPEDHRPEGAPMGSSGFASSERSSGTGSHSDFDDEGTAGGTAQPARFRRRSGANAASMTWSGQTRSGGGQHHHHHNPQQQQQQHAPGRSGLRGSSALSSLAASAPPAPPRGAAAVTTSASSASSASSPVAPGAPVPSAATQNWWPRPTTRALAPDRMAGSMAGDMAGGVGAMTHHAVDALTPLHVSAEALPWPPVMVNQAHVVGRAPPPPEVQSSPSPEESMFDSMPLETLEALGPLGPLHVQPCETPLFPSATAATATTMATTTSTAPPAAFSAAAAALQPAAMQAAMQGAAMHTAAVELTQQMRSVVPLSALSVPLAPAGAAAPAAALPHALPVAASPAPAAEPLPGGHYHPDEPPAQSAAPLPPTLAAAYELYAKLGFLLASILRGDNDGSTALTPQQRRFLETQHRTQVQKSRGGSRRRDRWRSAAAAPSSCCHGAASGSPRCGLQCGPSHPPALAPASPAPPSPLPPSPLTQLLTTPFPPLPLRALCLLHAGSASATRIVRRSSCGTSRSSLRPTWPASTPSARPPSTAPATSPPSGFDPPSLLPSCVGARLTQARLSAPSPAARGVGIISAVSLLTATATVHARIPPHLTHNTHAQHNLAPMCGARALPAGSSQFWPTVAYPSAVAISRVDLHVDVPSLRTMGSNFAGHAAALYAPAAAQPTSRSSGDVAAHVPRLCYYSVIVMLGSVSYLMHTSHYNSTVLRVWSRRHRRVRRAGAGRASARRRPLTRRLLRARCTLSVVLHEFIDRRDRGLEP